MIELERTFLAKYLPSDLKKFKFKELIDIYIPDSDVHPKLRIRKNGNKFEITKKEPIDGDCSRLNEQNIILNEEEFNVLSNIKGKRVRKLRYNYPYKGLVAEFDVFLDDLNGLVLIDFEFNRDQEKNDFQMPDFCLADVTNEEFVAGGKICGKSYEIIKKDLERYGYKKLIFND